MGKWGRAMYMPSTQLGEDGRRATASEKHLRLARRAGTEGMVLLKNEKKVLPLAKGSKLALFGKGVFDYVKGGGGSGDVTVSHVRNLYDGLTEVKGAVELYEPLNEYYKKNVAKQYENGAQPGLTVEPELPEELLAGARDFTDTALIVISRFSGEGWDRVSCGQNYPGQTDGEKNQDAMNMRLFGGNDYKLTDAEQVMVNKVKDSFAKVIVVLNVGGVVDTSWFVDDPQIPAVLYAIQGGMEGGLAMADVLLGRVNPSGKLMDTFAKRLENYPSTDTFHTSAAFVEYFEDIYVGYRYFETIAPEAVNYPFGFGLSYTQFTISPLWAGEKDGVISVAAEVKNTGDTAGKEVVQLYYSAPQGLLGKPARELAAFEKTKELAPGESQVLVLSFEAASMASYDDLGKVQKSAYVLEAGEYALYLGNSVRNTVKLEYSYSVAEVTVTEQLSEKMRPEQLAKRLLADGIYEALPQYAPFEMDANVLPPIEREDEFETPAVKAAPRRRPEWAGRDKEAQLMDVVEGKMSLDAFLDILTTEECIDLLGGQPNVGVANTYGIGNNVVHGIPSLMTADGPAGVRIAPHCGVCTTAWPCATLLACTWNKDLVYEVGAAGGLELKENNLSFWLTPAVNIHRTPICGRNFEYYSEDPLLAGTLAAAMVNGIQSNGVGATVKHFVANNKETNRKDCDSRVSERALREIYLKVFEIVVKESQPWMLMTAYNPVNGHRASESRELITDILRGEWGFTGVVTTDWWTMGEHYKETLAGNDIKMGTGYPERIEMALEKGAITESDIRVCAKRVLEAILKVE